MNVAQFVCSLTVGSHLDDFQFGATIDRAATNILLYTSSVGVGAEQKTARY